MSDQEPRRPTRRLEEPLHFDVVTGPPEYDSATQDRISVVDVTEGARVLGYLWAAYDDKAAGFEPHLAMGDDAWNAAVSWNVELRGPRARGLGALAALDELISPANPTTAGRIVPASRRDMSGLAELRALAARA